jgi:hypothetical protein
MTTLNEKQLALIAPYFAGKAHARAIFDACVAGMKLDPFIDWEGDVLRFRRWYPCVRILPADDALVLELDLYGPREHPRLTPLGAQWNALRLSSLEEVDDEAIAFLDEAMAIGNMK